MGFLNQQSWVQIQGPSLIGYFPQEVLGVLDSSSVKWRL